MMHEEEWLLFLSGAVRAIEQLGQNGGMIHSMFGPAHFLVTGRSLGNRIELV